MKDYRALIARMPLLPPHPPLALRLGLCAGIAVMIGALQPQGAVSEMQASR